MPTADQQIGRIAARQYGVVARAQAHRCGLSDKQIRHRVAAGRWVRVYPGAFRIAGAPPTPESDIAAAVLALPHSWISFEAAARLWGRPVSGHAPPSITRAHGSATPLAGVTIHQSVCLPAHHVTRVGSLPITTRARTVVDLAGVLDDLAAGRFLDDLLVARQLRLGQVERVFRDLAAHGRAGTRRTARLLDARVGTPPTESMLESRFDDLCRRAGLPAGVRQTATPWSDGGVARRVDVAYPGARLIVELDGRRYHAQLDAMAADRRRDQAAVAAGWRVLRFSWFDVVHEPARVTDVLRALLVLER